MSKYKVLTAKYRIPLRDRMEGREVTVTPLSRDRYRVNQLGPAVIVSKHGIKGAINRFWQTKGPDRSIAKEVLTPPVLPRTSGVFQRPSLLDETYTSLLKPRPGPEPEKGTDPAPAIRTGKNPYYGYLVHPRARGVRTFCHEPGCRSELKLPSSEEDRYFQCEHCESWHELVMQEPQTFL